MTEFYYRFTDELHAAPVDEFDRPTRWKITRWKIYRNQVRTKHVAWMCWNDGRWAAGNRMWNLSEEIRHCTTLSQVMNKVHAVLATYTKVKSGYLISNELLMRKYGPNFHEILKDAGKL